VLWLAGENVPVPDVPSSPTLCLSSPGVQEYVEAATFYSYNVDGSVYTREQLSDQLKFDDGVSGEVL
jgi:hypothetical protein